MLEEIEIRPYEQGTPLEDVKALLEEAFPPQERRRWDAQQQLIAAEKVKLLLLEKNRQFAGFVIYWALSDFYFIEYIAIHPDMRGGGAGSQVMRTLEKALFPLVLESEAPHTEIASRRVGFYERLGYVAWPHIYLQPPYHQGDAPVEMLLMQKGMHPDEPTFFRIKQELYRVIYGITA